MNLEFLEEFKDPYLKGDCGKGYFLAGVVLGMVAYYQSKNSEGKPDILSSPVFKRLQLGRLDIHVIRRELSRVPTLLAAYNISDGRILKLLSKALEFIEKCGKDLGTDGNFVFTMGFVGAPDYYFGKIFPKTDGDKSEETE